MAAHQYNPADNLRTYTASELERIAREYLQDNSADEVVPVDIDRILEEMPGVDLDYWPSLAANHGLHGMAGVDDNGILRIFVDDKLADCASSLCRYRMTVAEELAHVILHRDAIEAVREPEHFKALQSHPSWHTHDRNAKRLAAALLMPADSLINDSREMFHSIMHTLSREGISPLPSPERIINLMEGKLADRYQVSAVSMKYRLNEWPVNVVSKVNEAMKNGLDFLD